MVSSSEIINVIAAKLQEYRAQNIVLDPVMVSTSGYQLIDSDAIKSLTEQLIPLASIITPNLAEAQLLSGIKITDCQEMIAAAKRISASFKGFILIKGGHLDDDMSPDLLYKKDQCHWLESARVINPNTHGTGCTLSSAISANLAQGYDMLTAVQKAKELYY